MLALIGMIARNSVILIDQIETEKAHGRHPWDAVVEATMHRFRPILLTAAAAILGMIPIAPTVFWGPMAYAIMGGLAVATLLTLVFLPALYVAWFRIGMPHLEAGPEQEPMPSSDERQASRTWCQCPTSGTGWPTSTVVQIRSPNWGRQARAELGTRDAHRPPLLSAIAALIGALIGGTASLIAAIYTQRYQDRLQRIAREIDKREMRLRGLHHERFEVASQGSGP